MYITNREIIPVQKIFDKVTKLAKVQIPNGIVGIMDSAKSHSLHRIIQCLSSK